MKTILKIVMIAIISLMAITAESKGGSSGGGGGGSRGGFSGGGSRSYSSSPANRPSAAPSSIRQTTTTTSISRSTSSPRSYSTHVNYGGGMMYGGFGMGYGYSNGLLTGMIIANMMHPQGTAMYAGPGSYGNNALLYPDGRVVNQQGYLVGNYQNGQFSAVSDGSMVAQAVPQDAFQQQQPIQVAQPVVIQDKGGAILLAALFISLVVVLFIFIIVI